MKIGLLSFEYPPETGFGGIGSYTWYQARALARLGHEVHVLAGLKEQGPLTTLERNDIFVHRYRPGGLAMQLFGGLGRWKCWWSRQRLENGWGMYLALKALQERYRFDVLEMPECGAEGLLINSRIDVPTIVGASTLALAFDYAVLRRSEEGRIAVLVAGAQGHTEGDRSEFLFELSGRRGASQDGSQHSHQRDSQRH